MDLYKANFREVMTFAIFRPSIYLVSIIATIIVIGSGSYFVLGNAISIGTLFIFITYISSFFEPIQVLAEQFGTLQSALASAEKIFSVLDEKPEIVNPEHPVEVNINGILAGICGDFGDGQLAVVIITGIPDILPDPGFPGD